MRVTNSHRFLVLVVALGVLGAACSSADSDSPATATPVAEVISATDVPDDTLISVSTSPTPDALPNWVSDALDTQETIRYIANTGGSGVSHRSACAKDARLDGVWAEGAILEIVLESASDCADWSLLSDGEVTSWVANEYLSITEPAISSSSWSGGGGASSVQVLVYQQWQLPLSGLRVMPAADTWCETDSWHDASGTNITQTISGEPFSNPDARACGFGSVTTTRVIWVSAP